MKILLLTSNQPRHLHLINLLESICDELTVVIEATTVKPGKNTSHLGASDTKHEYFTLVQRAEQEVFEKLYPKAFSAKLLFTNMGDLSHISNELKESINDCNLAIIFGASYIKNATYSLLSKILSINIHMGLSPYYKGSSCNFWAMYDKKPDYIGSTVHKLTDKIDSGDILFTNKPDIITDDPFIHGMNAVMSVHKELINKIKSGELHNMNSFSQDHKLCIRESRYSDFTDKVVQDFLNKKEEYSSMLRYKIKN